jgi:hypothetical protein
MGDAARAAVTAVLDRFLGTTSSWYRIQQRGDVIRDRMRRSRVESALVAAEITPRAGKEREAARVLQAMGFCVHAVGSTVSVDAPPERWRSTFAARFAPARRARSGQQALGAVASSRTTPVEFRVPQALEPLVEAVVFIEPPEFF